jgi:outer membrane immunogenic protein
MRIFLLVSSTAVLVALSGAGLAADSIAPRYDWSGPYVGAFGGYAFGNSDASGSLFDEGPATHLTFGLDPDGFVAGLDAGYNWQIDSIVFGLEAEASYNFAEDSSVVFVSESSNGVVDDDHASVEFGFQGALTGRLGFAADRTLLYAKGGLAIADIDQSAGDLDFGGVVDPSDLASFSKTLFGYVVGGGIEFAVSDSLSTFVEYNYSDFEDTSVISLDEDNVSFSNSMNVVKAGINFHF